MHAGGWRVKAEKFSLVKADKKEEAQPPKAAKKEDEEGGGKEGEDVEEGGSEASEEKAETPRENDVQPVTPANGTTTEYTSEVIFPSFYLLLSFVLCSFHLFYLLFLSSPLFFSLGPSIHSRALLQPLVGSFYVALAHSLFGNCRRACGRLYSSTACGIFCTCSFYAILEVFFAMVWGRKRR